MAVRISILCSILRRYTGRAGLEKTPVAYNKKKGRVYMSSLRFFASHWRYYVRLFWNSFLLSLLGAGFVCLFCFLGQDAQGSLFPWENTVAPAGISTDQQVENPNIIVPIPAQWLPQAEAAAQAVQQYAFLIPAPLRLLHQIVFLLQDLPPLT